MKKSVVIELDKARNLRYGLNALCEMEDLLEKPISQIQTDENNAMGMREIRIMLYCGLKWEDKDLTLEKSGEIADTQNLNYIIEKVTEALTLSVGEEEGKKNLAQVAK